MVMAVVAILMVGVVAYFHYVQGIFSAVLSAILAVIAAMLAFSYHEVLARAFLASKIPNAAHALSLVALFGVIYMVLRVIFDSAVPGNVRVPVLVDKIGAGVAGAVAGVFATGIFVIAAQAMPFGPAVAGYSRYELVDSLDTRVPSPRGGQSTDTFVHDVLRSDRKNDAEHQALILPVDDFVVSLAAHLSDGGSLAGPQPLEAVHPHYLDELFFQRLGIQTGALHVAYNIPGGDKQVTLNGLYAAPTALPQADAEAAFIPQRFQTTPLNNTIKPDASNVVLIARITIDRSGGDKDNNVRLSPGAVRLMAGGENYYPVGTLDLTQGALVRANRLDDFIIAGVDKPIDLVFDVPAEALGATVDTKNPAAPITLGQGVFLEVKRLGYIDLSNKEVVRSIPTDPNGIVRKKNLPPPK
jgi:hypothetical protein